MRTFPLMVLLLAAVTACGSPAGSGGSRSCTDIGARVGIGIDLQPVIAAKAGNATLIACWSGTCTTRTVELYPATAAGPTTCTSGTCSVQAIPTGGKNGFADLPGLPSTPVQLTVTLDGFADQKLDVTPKPSYPNGPNCDAGGPQAQVVVDDTGIVTER
jgi:hypothetical protein